MMIGGLHARTVAGLVPVGLLLGLCTVVPVSVSALGHQNNVNVSFGFEPMVTIALSGANGTDLIIDDLAPGSAADSNIITVTAGTNSGTGYNLTATAGSTDSSSPYYNSNDLKNGSNTMPSLTSIAANLNAITVGRWGYSYSVDSGTSWISGSVGSTSAGYAGLPAVNDTAVTLVSPNTNTTSAVQFKIAANAGATQTAGTYGNVVNFVVTVKPITTNYTITYYDGDTAMSTPAPVAGTISSGNNTTVTLDSSATKSGYTLDGWCYGTLTNGNCSGTIYQPGDSYTVGNIGGTATINLVAVWKKELSIYMQDQTTSSLALIMPNVGDTATLYDKRDGKSYTVAHLADGNYWMTQNLDHDIKTDGSVTYDSTTTDIPSAWTPSAATYATGTTTWNLSAIAPESYDPGDLCWNGILDENYETTLSNGATACGDDKHYHIGNYYNWTAAVAMNNSSSYATQNTDVNQSICPAGWRLPIGGTSNTSSKSFQYLVGQLSLTSGTSGNIQNSPVYFVYGGAWFGSSSVVGSGGDYWSSVVSDSGSAYRLVFGVDGSLDPQTDIDRPLGSSVRCVARDREFMQDQTTSSLAAMMPNVGDTAVLTDKRDGKNYTIGRLKMNSASTASAYWMLDNLALDITSVNLDTLIGNTNADDTSLTALKNGHGATHYAQAPVSKAWTSSTQDAYDKPMIAVDSATSGPCYNAYCVNGGTAGSPWSYDSVTSTSILSDTSVVQGKVGVFYNYCAASAGYFCYGDGAGVDNPEGITTLRDSKYDICPSGWRLPTSSSAGEFQTLYDAYGNDYTAFQTALSTPLSGTFYSGNAYYLSGSGAFWSSTFYGTNSMHLLYVQFTNTYPSNLNVRYYGYSIRCILAQ